MNGPRYSRLLAPALAVLAAVTVAAPATAQQEQIAAAPPTLAGAWAPLNRCPVDDPAMLAASGNPTSASCLASESTGGTMRLGSTTVATGATNLQAGLLTTANVATLVAPRDGAILAEPVRVPGGLLGLMCPSAIPVVSGICETLIENNPLNVVTATVRSAGAPSEFNLAAGLGVGQPILRLPVKIQLSNPFLGSNCFIGSNANPIVLRPANLSRPTVGIVRFNPDGTLNPTGVMGYAVASGASQGDSTFAVPEADGCGLFGTLDFAVNQRQGLPSPAGQNSLVLNNTTTRFGGHFQPAAFAPDQGRRLAEAWHAAVVD